MLTIGKSESRNDQGEMVSNGTEYEPGLNAKWAITPEFSLDATINPDFSQVESDSPQLSVNQTFALFFEERRPFFQEGSNYFNSVFNAIYTRNVTDPEYGMKLTGRKDKHTIGAFYAKDAITNVTVPGTFGSDFSSIDSDANAFAARYRYDFTSNFNLGLVSTYRDAQDYRNALFGVDGFFRYNNKHKFAFQYLNSDTDNPLSFREDFDLPESQTGDAFNFRYDFSTRNWFQYFRYRDIDKDFRADLGFITQVNNDQFVIGGGRNWYNENSWWNRIEVGGDWDITHDNDGNVLEREIEGRIEINGALQSYFNFGVVSRDRLFDDVLFDELFANSFFVFQPKRGLLLELGSSFGDRIDFGTTNLGKNLYLFPGIHYSLNKNTELLVHHTYDRLKVDGVRERIANLTDFRLTYQISTRSFLRLTAQYQNIKSESLALEDLGAVERDRDFNTQLLYSYKVNPRTVFFLGYSDLADSTTERPNLQVQERGLFMKIGYVFN